MSAFRHRLFRSGVLALATAAALFTAACVTAPVDPATLSCKQLADEVAFTRQARVQAQEKQRDPWQFVIPFAVAGHHVSGHSALSDADRWLAALDEQAHSKHCVLRF